MTPTKKRCLRVKMFAMQSGNHLELLTIGFKNTLQVCTHRKTQEVFDDNCIKTNNC